MKALAVLLYAMGNASLGMLGRLRGVSSVAVYKWIRQEAEALPAPSANSAAGLVQIDELGHFVEGKKTRFGSGGPMILWHGEPGPGNGVGVIMRASNGSSINSASPRPSS
jgi:transposase